MDALLWILIGIGAGLIVATLAPERHPHSRTGSAHRRILGAGAGLVGAVVAGYVFVAVAAPNADDLTTAMTSLAGGLWAAAIVEAYAARRRKGESSAVELAAPRVSPDAIDMPAYDAARQALVTGLIEDAQAHDAGRYAEIGRLLPGIRQRVAREDSSRNHRLQLALRFWRGWTDARNQHWRITDVEQSISAADWPRLARVLASDLALDRDITDPVIRARFA